MGARMTGAGTGHALHAAPPEVRREGVTMALYLAIVLLAESAPLQTYDADSAEVAAAYWGSAVGLAAAHVFAFTVSARLVTHARLDEVT